MNKTTICLWYDHDAEAAARFYAATFPDSAVFGVPCLDLNGGDRLQQSEAHGEPDRCRIP